MPFCAPGVEGRHRCASGGTGLWLMLAVACAIFFIAAAVARAQETPAEPSVYEQPPAEQPSWLEGYRVRYLLRVVGDPNPPVTPEGAAPPAPPPEGAQPPWPETIVARLPTGGWLRPDAGDIAVQNASGEQVPVAVLSHDPLGDTIIQFKRREGDRWYWAYAAGGPGGPKMEPAAEGLVAEFRQWEGEELSDWAQVHGGLVKSENVIGNAVVAEVIQNYNPARPNDPRNFASSYRGTLFIPTAGVYRFFVNADDAAFLFIDGERVTERTGANTRLTGRLPISTIGTNLELAAGPHKFEVHQVVGNNPAAMGFCGLIWIPPGATNWAFVPRTAFVQSLFAEVAGVEAAGGGPVATFASGIEDALLSGGVQVYLVRFEAQGYAGDPAQLAWDFGDGTRGTGRTVTKVYFAEGEHKVTLTAPGAGGAPFTRRVHVWAAPVVTSPLSLGRAVRALSESNWQSFTPQQLNDTFEFLLVSEQPERWPLLEAVSRQILAQPSGDPQQRALAYQALMRALAEQGRAAEALAMLDAAAAEFESVPSLQVGVKLAAADIYRELLKQPEDAVALYREIIEKHRRVAHPDVRKAAIHWGDLYAEAGDMASAAETYRLAETLGGEEFRPAGVTDAVSRGAMLRVAEQKLRSGDVRESRRLLERIEMDFPEQKLEGLYRFLRAEADRYAGRYEEAIRGYETILRLPQWGGFRDRALHGIADSHFRLGELEKTLEWLAPIRETYPDYWDQQKLAEYERMVENRLARLEAAREEGAESGQRVTALSVSFSGLTTGFEPEEAEQTGEPTAFSFVPGPGMDGPYVGLLEGFPVSKGYFGYNQRLRNLTSEGWYWVEFWYREALESSAVTGNPHIHVWLYGTGSDLHPAGGTSSWNIDRTWGQWRKLGFRVRAPITQDGRLEMSIRQVLGAMQIDGLSIQPISDRQLDSLNSFIEGAPSQ